MTGGGRVPTAQKSIAWQKDANCAGTNPTVFHEPARISEAKAVCRGCVVRDDCLTYSNTAPVEEEGVWGGLDEHERRKIRSRNRAERAAQRENER